MSGAAAGPMADVAARVLRRMLQEIGAPEAEGEAWLRELAGNTLIAVSLDIVRRLQYGEIEPAEAARRLGYLGFNKNDVDVALAAGEPLDRTGEGDVHGAG